MVLNAETGGVSSRLNTISISHLSPASINVRPGHPREGMGYVDQRQYRVIGKYLPLGTNNSHSGSA